jgi:large subunit ribosomal protein L18
MAITAAEGRTKRKKRIRKKMSGTPDRPRLSVFRSTVHIYAQVIDDTTGKTLVASSTLKKDVNSDGTKTDQAKAVGEAIAKACQAQGVSKVVFDRNGFLYHGRVRALADAARGAGLDF